MGQAHAQQSAQLAARGMGGGGLRGILGSQAQAQAQQAEMEAIKATPAMMNTPMADPSKNPALAQAMQPPPEEI